MSIQITKIFHPLADKAKINLHIARADKIHPLASGNKYYKLKQSLSFAKENHYKGLLSFGGAFSNHIHALALTTQAEGFESVGIIRGEVEYANNTTLSMAKSAGMQLEFVNRKTYRLRGDPKYLKDLQKCYPDYLILPEGGSNQLAISGCMELGNEINQANTEKDFDALLVAAGTGATVAGLVCAASNGQNIIAYAVLRDESLKVRIDSFIKNEISIRTKELAKYKIEQASFGAYAKFDKDLLDFIVDWYDQTGILLDPIYTSKLCMRLMQQIEAGEFEAGANLCIVHTGGLQGWFGMQDRVIKLAGDKVWERIHIALEN